MTAVEAIDMVVNDYGFVKYGTCNCGGFTTYKYRRGKFVIYFRVTKDLWKLKEAGSTIKQFTPTDELEAYLQAKIPHLRTGSEIQG